MVCDCLWEETLAFDARCRDSVCGESCGTHGGCLDARKGIDNGLRVRKPSQQSRYPGCCHLGCGWCRACAWGTCGQLHTERPCCLPGCCLRGTGSIAPRPLRLPSLSFCHSLSRLPHPRRRLPC